MNDFFKKYSSFDSHDFERKTKRRGWHDSESTPFLSVIFDDDQEKKIKKIDRKN